MKIWTHRITMACAAVGIATLVACGGGGGGSTTSSGSTISGIAASGAAMVGTVKAKDSNGRVFGPVQIAADGRYTLNTQGGVAPFLIEATGNTGTYYSVTSASPIANLNVTPLTTMVLAQAAGVTPSTLFGSCSASPCGIPSATKTALASANVNAMLTSLYTLFGVNSSINLMTDVMVAGAVTGQSAIDKMLDALSFVPVPGTQASFQVKPNSITGLNIDMVLATMPDAPSGGAAIPTTAPLTIHPALNKTAVAAATDVLNKLAEIQKGFDSFNNLFATSTPSSSNSNLLSYFSPSFQNDGQMAKEFVYRMTTLKEMGPVVVLRVKGAANPPALPSPQIANDSTHQWFTYSSTYSSTDSVWLMTRATIDAPWLIMGNQLPATIELGTPVTSNPGWQTAPCCTPFQVTVPFKTHGFELNYAGVNTANAVWEFSNLAVPLCDAPAPNSGGSCASSWNSKYQTPPFLNPGNTYAGPAGSYYALKDDAATSTSGNLKFAFSYHLKDFQTNPNTGSSSYVLVGPATISVTAVLAVTVTNPADATTKVVRSKPITVTSYIAP